MSAPGKVAALKSLQNETLFLETCGRLILAQMVYADIRSRFAGQNPETPVRSVGAVGEENDEKKTEERGDKAVLTSRQGPGGSYGGEASGLENYGSVCLP
ncbi:hypothetical protein X777_08985 [Ooceraea biroi]|uniref:Uncharacterized protein n=1 Tax=Ooceraea biroi TaxID=2015173 RepID=A0A026W8D2_OOCBI|nr:hypothetical protein X777_08985 [Ooceraea biroi]